MILNQDNPAPFRGVLVPPETFKRMWIDIKERDMLKSELQVCLDNKTQYQETSAGTWLTMGIGAGLMTAIILSATLK